MAKKSGIDTTGLDQIIDGIQRQVPFATAKALTMLARDGQAAAMRQVETAFDSPVAFTKKGFAIKPATKQLLVSQVFAKDIQAGYLSRQEVGATVTPRVGAPLIVPVNIRVNRAGNIPRGAIRRRVSSGKAFVVGRGGSLPPGVYSRPTKAAARRGKGGAKLLAAFIPQANYRPRFGFNRAVTKVVSKNVKRRWEEALAGAIRTMRR